MTALTYRGEDFDREAAQAITDDIRAWAGTLWLKVEAAYLGRAWVALGYPSWGAYLDAELDISRGRGYQLVAHATAVRQLAAAAGVEVSTAVDIPERATRAGQTRPNGLIPIYPIAQFPPIG